MRYGTNRQQYIYINCFFASGWMFGGVRERTVTGDQGTGSSRSIIFCDEKVNHPYLFLGDLGVHVVGSRRRRGSEVVEAG